MRHLILVFAVIFSLFLLPACKKKDSRSKERAKRTAAAKYSCDEVKWISEAGDIHKLDVCGTIRWYECVIRCNGCDRTCKEIKSKKW